MHESFDGVDFLDISDLSHEDAEAYVVKYRYNGQLFSVLISTTPPEGCEREGAIELSWIDRLWDLSSHLGDDHARLVEQEQGETEIAREIRDVVFPTLERLAPSPNRTIAGASEPVPVQKRVAEYLFPPCIRLELVTKSGELEVLSGHGEELDRKRMVVSWSVMGEVGFERGSVPTFDARDVLLGPRLVTSPPLMDVFDVSIPGVEERVVGKLGCAMDDSQQAIRREMEIYGRLRKVRLDPEARVPELKGLITNGNGVVGFIITKISVKHPSLLPFVTSNLKSGISDPSLRRKWAAQVEHTVKELHRHGVVWGDAKPDNVVIDFNDNAWVLDFGGGGTPGWMELSMFQTREGDLHAVERMRDGLWSMEGAE